MTRKRLSMRSYVRTTAVKPWDWGGISGRKSGLFTLLHFYERYKKKRKLIEIVENTIQIQNKLWRTQRT